MVIKIKQIHGIGDDEIRQLSHENPGYQFERDREGQLLVSPTGGQSGRRSGEVYAQLRTWAHDRNAGPVFDASTGFKLPDGTLRSPDAAWIRKERWNALTEEEREGFPPLCPDAVFEVRSRTDSPDEVSAKLQAYVENGARLAVMIDPYSRSVEVLTLNRELHPRYDVVNLDEVLPGFSLDLRALDPSPA